MRRLLTGLKAAAWVALILGATSCASSKRAMRISPFAESKAVGHMGAGRVNIWPLAYRDGQSTSILWPVVDWDDRGFAVRPLYNKEGDDQSILFPLSSWNAWEGHGWAGPFYWFDGVFGAFPFLHWGENSHWVAPVYWGDDKFGVPGVCHLGPQFNYVGPVWWSDSPRGLASRGLFPLISQRELNDPDASDLRLGMGLLGKHTRTADESLTWVAPLFYNKRKGESLLRLALPSWMEMRDENDGFKTLFPLFLSLHDDESKALITPLGGYGSSKYGETTLLNIGGPIYHWHRTEEGTFTAIAWPFYQQTKSYNAFSATSWPLLTHMQTKNDRTTRLLVLGGALYQRPHDTWALWGSQRVLTKQERTSWRSWPFISSLRHSPDQVKDPLFKLSLINAFSYRDQGGLLITPFFGYTREATARDIRAWPFYTYKKETAPIRVRHGFLALGSVERTEWENKLSLWPVFTKTESERQAYPDLFDRCALMSFCNGRSNWDHQAGFGLIYHRSGETDGNTSRSQRSFLTLAGAHNWRRAPQTAVEAWSRSYGLSNDCSIRKDGWYVFPLIFSRQSHSLRLFSGEDETRDRLREWMSLDARRNAPESKVAPAEARLADVLAGHDRAAAVMREAGSLQGKEKSERIRAALALFANDHSRLSVSKDLTIPLIYTSRRVDENRRWSFLLGAANYHRDEDNRRLSILRYLYRVEKTPDHTYRDIFPFITWNSSRENKQFSFLWRVLNIKRDGEGKSGHIFFIPFGRKQDSI